MADQDLELNLVLKRDQSKADAEKVRQDMRALNQAMAGDAKRSADDAARWYTDAQGRMRDATGKFVSDARKQQAGLATGFGDVGKAGQQSFASIGAAAGAALLAFKAVTSTLSGIGAEFARVGEKAKQLSKDLAGDRDSLRELAQLRGRDADTAFTVDLHREAREARMTFGEARQFQTQFYGSGAAAEGKFGADQFGKFRGQAAAYTAAQGLDAGDAGTLAGSFLGFKDYGRVAEGKRAETALSDLHTAFAVLQRGKGENPVLARQMSRVGASMVNEDSMRGIFQSPTEAAIAVSTAAEASPADAAEQVRAVARGMRAFGDKDAGPLLARAKITPGTPFTQGIRQLAPVVEEEARAGGLKTKDVLDKYFKENLTAEAIGVQINRGLPSAGDVGVYADRAGVAQTAAAPGGAASLVSRFQKTETGQQRAADADVKLAEAERAAENSDLTIVRQQALARLIRRKEIDTDAAGVQDFINQKITFGMMGSAESKRVDDEAQRALAVRTGEAPKASLNLTPEGRAKEMNAMLLRFKAKGGATLLPAGDEEGLIDTRQGAFLQDGKDGAEGDFAFARANPGAVAGEMKERAGNWLRGAMGFEGPRRPAVMNVRPPVRGADAADPAAGGDAVKLLQEQNKILERVAKNTDRPPAPNPRPVAGPNAVRR